MCMQVSISTSPSLHVTATRYQRFVLIALALAGLDIQVCINVAGLVLIMAFGVWKSLAATHHYIPHLVTADLAASRFFGWMLPRTRCQHPECVLSRKKNAPRLFNLNGGSEHGHPECVLSRKKNATTM